ncbi:hypothetical protein ASD80_16290 [Devosia sp. Root635]|nr:hypothetical protein ASD80_16290 [Devosia sp. Root635]
MPDLVFIVTPAKFVLDTLEEAATLGVASCVVVSAEAGNDEERRAFRDRIAQLAKSSGMRIIGPNSMGLMNGQLSLNGSFASGTASGKVPAGTMACLSQSGATLSAMLQWFGESSVGFSWLISTGDESATRTEDLLQAMADDPDVQSIMLFLEGVADGIAFRKAALNARLAGKPVILLQVGKSAKGREAVASHTGRVAGTREVFTGVARETGIIETESFVEFFGTAKALSQHPHRRDGLGRGRRAAMLTVSGGAASLGADQIYAIGWELPEFSPVGLEALEAATGQHGLRNPADIGGVWRDPEKISRAMSALAQEADIDTLFISLGAGGVFGEAVGQAIVAAAADITQDVFVAWVGMSDSVSRILDQGGIPAFADLPLAVRAAEACAQFSMDQERVQEATDLSAALSRPLGDIAMNRSDATGLWTVTETLEELRQAGLPCADFAVVAGLDAEQVAAQAAEIGFPIVLKLSSSDLNHKSDDGGVAVGLRDAAAVADAVAKFTDIANRKRLRNVSVLIQRMERGAEILVGIKRDASFGPVLVVGLGGTLAELHGEVAATALPTTPAVLNALLERNDRLKLILAGYRGQPAADRDSLVSFLTKFSEWALNQGPRLQEVDLNPVMISGGRISIVDARAIWN